MVNFQDLKHYIKLYFLFLGAQIRSQSIYRFSFAFDSVATALITLTEFAAFALVLPRFGSLDGWTLGEVALLYGMAELAFVSMDILFGGFDSPNLSRIIRTNMFDTFLLRPVPLAVQVFGSDLALRRIGRVLFAAWILFYGTTHTNISWTAEYFGLMLSSFLGLVAFFGGLFIIGGSLTYWTVQSVEAMNVLTYGGRTLISYPMEIYGAALRKTFTYLIPAAFLSYFPFLKILGRPLPDGLPDWVAYLSLPVGLIGLVLAFLVFRFGIRHYRRGYS